MKPSGDITHAITSLISPTIQTLWENIVMTNTPTTTETEPLILTEVRADAIIRKADAVGAAFDFEGERIAVGIHF